MNNSNSVSPTQNRPSSARSRDVLHSPSLSPPPSAPLVETHQPPLIPLVETHQPSFIAYLRSQVDRLQSQVEVGVRREATLLTQLENLQREVKALNGGQQTKVNSYKNQMHQAASGIAGAQVAHGYNTKLAIIFSIVAVALFVVAFLKDGNQTYMVGGASLLALAAACLKIRSDADGTIATNKTLMTRMGPSLENLKSE